MENQSHSVSNNNEVNRKILYNLIARHSGIKAEIERADRGVRMDRGSIDWRKYRDTLEAQADGIEFSIFTMLDAINDQEFRDEITRELRSPERSFYDQNVLYRDYIMFKYAYETVQGTRDPMKHEDLIREIYRSTARLEYKKMIIIDRIINEFNGDLSTKTLCEEELTEESINTAWLRGKLSGDIVNLEDTIHALKKITGSYPEAIRKPLWEQERLQGRYAKYYARVDQMEPLLKAVYVLPWFLGVEIYRNTLMGNYYEEGNFYVMSYRKIGMSEDKFIAISKDGKKMGGVRNKKYLKKFLQEHSNHE